MTSHTAIASNGADVLADLVASSGISLRLWHLYAQSWLVCLIFPVLALVQTRMALLNAVSATAGLAIFVITYTLVMWSHPLGSVARIRAQFQRSVLLLTGLTVLVLMLSVAYGSAFLWLFVGVSAIAGVTLTPRSAF